MEIELLNFEKEKLSNNLNSNNSNILAIMVHGFMGSKDFDFFVELENYFDSIEIDSFRFDFSGNGKSQGLFSESTISKQKKELNNVLNYFKKKYEKILIIAHSMGCSVSLKCSESNNFNGLIMVNPLVLPSIIFKDSILKFSPYVFLEKLNDVKIKKEFTNFSLIQNIDESLKNKIKKNVVSKKFIKELPKINLINYAEKLKIPVLIIHGKKDIVIPFSHVEYLYYNINSFKKMALFDYSHNPEKKNYELIKFEIFKYIKEKFLK